MLDGFAMTSELRQRYAGRIGSQLSDLVRAHPLSHLHDAGLAVWVGEADRGCLRTHLKLHLAWADQT